MSNVFGLTKRNDYYADVPNDLKWAIPLHEHLTSAEAQRDWKIRKALAEQRVNREQASRQKGFQKRPKTLVRVF